MFFLSHHQAIDSEAKYTYGRVYDENLNIIKRWIKDAGFQVVEARQEAGQFGTGREGWGTVDNGMAEWHFKTIQNGDVIIEDRKKAGI